MSQNKKDVHAQVKHANNKLERLNADYRLQVITQASCYTYHMGIAKVAVDEVADWYSTSSCDKNVFKTWSECLIWVQGYRQAMIDSQGY